MKNVVHTCANLLSMPTETDTPDTQIEAFITHIETALAVKTFVKLTLGNYKGADKSLQKILVRPVSTKRGERLYFTYRHETNEIAKNYEITESLGVIRKALGEGFRSAHLFTTEKDVQLAVAKSGKATLKAGRPTFTDATSQPHDRAKASLVDPSRFYLKALGITDDTGRVVANSQDKWRQINKFVEILAALVDKSSLTNSRRLRIVDMGSGKGYLTFAAYDYFSSAGTEVEMTGVESRRQLVEKCNGIAEASGFGGLRFVEGTIAGYDAGKMDILIALHACNTATDDALYKGISEHAELIVAAPCCHQELRPQITPPDELRDVLRHGVMMERTAETLTDGLRSLLLEREGYATKLFEFVGVEHTPKNNMLAATRLAAPKAPERFQKQIDAIKSMFNIRRQHLEELLSK
jgi:hypothetical protein